MSNKDRDLRCNTHLTRLIQIKQNGAAMKQVAMDKQKAEEVQHGAHAEGARQ